MTTDQAPYAYLETNNGHPESAPPFGLPDVPFGAGHTQVVPHEWAAWILTAMRDHELKGGRPKHFSAWLADCVMANR